MKKACSIISSILLVIVVLIAILLAGVRVVGLTPYSVLSGSMEPTYHTGSLIYVKNSKPEDVKVGDPITFYLEDGKTIVTHRAIAIETGESAFQTKGDANNVPDPQLVTYSRLIGIPQFTIPYLGYLSAYISAPSGKMISAAVVLVILALSFIPDFISGYKSKDNNINETPENKMNKKRRKEL